MGKFLLSSMDYKTQRETDLLNLMSFLRTLGVDIRPRIVHSLAYDSFIARFGKKI